MSSTASIAHSHDAHHDSHSAHGDTQPSPVGLGNIKLAMWIFLVSEVMFFAGLIGSYIVLRFGTAGWPNPYDVLAVRVTAFNTFLLICSSVTMVKAFQWSDMGNRQRTIAYLIATIIGGAGFVGIQVYEYRHLLMQPSAGLLHHVEELMAERGLSAEHGSMGSATPDPRVILASDEGNTAASEAQNAALVKAHEVLKEGRPRITGSGESRLESADAAAAWDKKAMDEAILPLVAAFVKKEGDKTVISDSHIAHYARVHNQYPEGFVPSADVFTSTFYIMTGFHGAHVTGGVLMLIALLYYYLRGKAGTLGIEIIGLYWHFVDLVWIILFTIVYLM